MIGIFFSFGHHVLAMIQKMQKADLFDKADWLGLVQWIFSPFWNNPKKVIWRLFFVEHTYDWTNEQKSLGMLHVFRDYLWIMYKSNGLLGVVINFDWN